MTDGMTDELCGAVIDSLEALRICNEHDQGLQRFRTTHVVRRDRGISLQVLDDDAYTDPVCIEEMDLSTCQTSRIQFNRKFAETIMGCTAEELLARVAKGDVRFPSTELEFLCRFMDWFRSMGAMQYHSYHLISPGLAKNTVQGSPLFVHQTSSLFLNMAHGTVKVEMRMVPVSAEEYDAARLSEPSGCRPFLASIGDLRSSRQLLRDRTSDLRMTFQKLKQSEEGRALQGDLAAAIRARYSDVMKLAQCQMACTDRSTFWEEVGHRTAREESEEAWKKLGMDATVGGRASVATLGSEESPMTFGSEQSAPLSFSGEGVLEEEGRAVMESPRQEVGELEEGVEVGLWAEEVEVWAEKVEDLGGHSGGSDAGPWGEPKEGAVVEGEWDDSSLASIIANPHQYHPSPCLDQSHVMAQHHWELWPLEGETDVGAGGAGGWVEGGGFV